jgi:hypothetical protein
VSQYKNNHQTQHGIRKVLLCTLNSNLFLQLPSPVVEQTSPPMTAAKQRHADKANRTEAKRATKELTGGTKDKSEAIAGASPAGHGPPETFDREQLEKKYPIGTMIWGKLPGYDWWPGVLLSYSDGSTSGGGSGAKKESAAAATEEQQLSDDEESSCNVIRVWVKWYGDNQLSQVRKYSQN